MGQTLLSVALEVGLFLVYPKKVTFDSNINVNPNGGGQECPPHTFY
jgi:hypothetical protein